MSDINLLSTDESARDDKSNRAQKSGNEDMALHVPSQEPPEKTASPAGGSFLAQLIEKEAASETPAQLFSQKVEPISSTPSQPAPKPVDVIPVKAPPLPPAIPPKPPAPAFMKAALPPKPPLPPPPPPRKPPQPPKPEEDDKGAGTLRVSLITSNGGAGLSDLAVRRRQRTFAVIGLLGVLTDGLIFGGLHLRKLSIEKKNADATKAVQNIDTSIAAREKELVPVRDFQELSRAAARVLDAHAHWTEVLKLVEERALPNVQFGSMSGAETGTLGFEVIARDYTTLAKQIVAFRQDPRVKKVTVGTASAELGENLLLTGVRASMSLEIDPAIFRYKAETASAVSETKTP
ncbi:MAG: hypothetical protein WC866_02405 [Patescibacteria group bacterium]